MSDNDGRSSRVVSPKAAHIHDETAKQRALESIEAAKTAYAKSIGRRSFLPISIEAMSESDRDEALIVHLWHGHDQGDA